jgi:membrane protease YdiL (CAAX protease family)
VMPPIYAVLGVVGALTAAGDTGAEAGVGASASPAIVSGVVSGIALFAATRLAVPILGRWPAFARDTRAQYAPSREVGLGRALALSIVVVAGEEVLWRLAVQQDLHMDAAVAAAVVWVAYVAANLPSRSRPLVAGAVVGGAVWGALAWATGGVLAPLLSHAAWTSMMLVMPPTLARRKMEP